jgi:histidyl-tRNA synthetase
MAFGDRGLKGALKAADRSGAPWVVIVGEDEVASDTAVVKNMASGEQVTLPWEGVVAHLAEAMDVASRGDDQ